MKAVGIIAEYNPLHNGHIYHIEESRKLAGKDVVVVAMSGNYVQHGEPAILDKWERAKLAVENGADVVVEIPVLYCLGNSLQYASAGVRILESLGAVSHLSFGSECGNIELLKRVANNLKDDRIAHEIAKIAKETGCSYPRARAIAYEKLYGTGDLELLNGSNDNLAISYLSSLTELEPIAVRRKGANYSQTIDDKFDYQSATGIRQALITGSDISSYVTKDVYDALNYKITTNVEEWFNYLKYSIISHTATEIDNCPSGGEGLGNKIKNEINIAESWADLVLRVKSKRYTYSRISRLFMQLMLDINRSEYDGINPSYIRILALSKRGRELISYIEKNECNSLPIISNLNKQKNMLINKGEKILNLDIKATDLYNLVTGRSALDCSEYKSRLFIQ